jgi:uncharacterized protein
MGSRVIRGNLLVVPIGNSILYVTPLYLRAQTGQLPELKRVIAVYGDHVVMEQTLPEALAALFQAPSAAPASRTSAVINSIISPTSNTALEALAHYQRAIAELKAGNFGGFGSELAALQPLLEQMGGQLSPPTRAGTTVKPPH